MNSFVCHLTQKLDFEKALLSFECSVSFAGEGDLHFLCPVLRFVCKVLKKWNQGSENVQNCNISVLKMIVYIFRIHLKYLMHWKKKPTINAAAWVML